MRLRAAYFRLSIATPAFSTYPLSMDRYLYYNIFMYTDSNGISKSHEAWAKVAGIRPVTMRKRLRDLGWTVERAISEPVNIMSPNADRQAANNLARGNSAARLDAVRTILEWIKRAPCVDCKTCHDSEAMEFDHVPERGQKTFQISGCAGMKITAIVAEIAKCDLVCANCHRRRTKTRRKLKALDL